MTHRGPVRIMLAFLSGHLSDLGFEQCLHHCHPGGHAHRQQPLSRRASDIGQRQCDLSGRSDNTTASAVSATRIVGTVLMAVPSFVGVVYTHRAMLANRDRCSWCATVTVLVGPLRCLARMRSASPPRGSSRSNASGRFKRITMSASCSRLLWTEIPCATKLFVPGTVPS